MPKGNSIPQQKTTQTAIKKPPHKRYLFYISDIIKNIFGGLIIGSTMLVGGINCGTMAIVFGMYNKLIYAIGNIFKSFNYSFLLLLQIFIGIITGILLFSQQMLGLVKYFEQPMMYLFIGTILGSLPSIHRKSKVKKFKPFYLLFMFLGTGFVYALNFLPKNQLITYPIDFRGYGMLFICGALASTALMIPGIRVSHILLVMGMYEPILMAIVNLNLLHLFFIFLGFFAGSLLMAKILSSAIKRFPAQMYFMIIGFMLGCIIDIFPGIPNDYMIVACIAGLLFGLGFIYLISPRK